MSDIVERLQKIAVLVPGQEFPPELLVGGNWGAGFSALCADAVSEIARLRATIEHEYGDLGESALVIMRYKGKELGFVITPNHLDNDDAACLPLLKMRDVMKSENANV